MDFTQKIIDKQREVQELYQNEAAKKTLEKEADEEETEPEMEIPPPEDPDEEWLVLLSGVMHGKVTLFPQNIWSDTFFFLVNVTHWEEVVMFFYFMSR